MPKLRILAPDGRRRSVLLEPTERQRDLNESLKRNLAEIGQLLPADVSEQLVGKGLIMAARDTGRFLGILKTARLKRELDAYGFEIEP